MGIVVDIRPGIESAIVYAPFDIAKETLENQGYRIISLEENARLRIQQSKYHYVSQYPNWVREGVLYVPRERNKLVRVSPILESADKATQAHRKFDQEFYPTRWQIEQSSTDSIDFPERAIVIRTNRFDSEALTVYAFGGEKKAKAYGEFLHDAGIKKMPVYAEDKDYVNEQNKPFVRQLWFGLLSRKSALDGRHMLLYSIGSGYGVGNAVRGIKVDAEGIVVENK